MSTRSIRTLDGTVLPVAGGGDLAALAARQHDAVSAAQLAALGLSRHAIAHRVATGRLQPLHRGVYGLGRDHPLRAIAAALLACAPAVASHRTAAALWGLLPAHPPLPEVTVSRSRRPRRPGIAAHRAATADRRVHRGLPVTSPARTLLDLAATLPAHQLARALTEAHVKDLARAEALEAVLHTGRPGTRALKALLEAGVQRTRSRPERELLALCREARLPPPSVNATLLGLEVDALWPGRRLVVEVDTYGTHGHARAFAADRARDLTLRAAGYDVLRLTDAQLRHDRLAVAAVLAARLA